MNPKLARETILHECLDSRGFAALIRENKVDVEGFNRLLEAVTTIAASAGATSTIDRLTVACLFELPWEIENTVDHYRQQSVDLGKTVARMGEQLRGAIEELLWTGLEEYYKNIQ